jgi:Skp family chaperone for outer membrane proteins
MTIKVVNFETLSKHYKNYQDGITEISDVKKSFVEKLDPFKQEMEKIIKQANSGEKLEPETEARFNELQEYAVSVDDEFKSTMRKMNDDLSKKIYGELSEIISEWSSSKDIDLVIGSTEVVFMKPENDVTEDILTIIREKELHV